MKTVLIVDDETIVRQSLCDQLEDMGYQTLSAENGRIGLEIIEAEQPDLVLTDLRMPEMGGLELIKRSKQRAPDTPIIVISGAGRLEDAVEALRLGAYDYLVKPVNDFAVLEHVVTKTLENARLVHENLVYQSHLIESEKMASLGRLVSGVAHELNTPIGICVTASSYLQEKTIELNKAFLGDGVRNSDFTNYLDSATQSTEIIEANLNRASDLIKSFKEVAVDVSSEVKRSFYLLDYISMVLQSLLPDISRVDHHIDIEGEQELEVHSYPGILSQVVTNLVMNSLMHAYSEGEKGHIIIRAVREGDEVHLTYSDDGRGMTPETAAKVFEPFYTTLGGPGGSGLGMFILYNLITHSLGGEVICTSEPGKGVTFVMTFLVTAS